MVGMIDIGLAVDSWRDNGGQHFRPLTSGCIEGIHTAFPPTFICTCKINLNPKQAAISDWYSE